MTETDIFENPRKYLVAHHRVRSYELDSFGHVNNAVYLNYLEYARTEYLVQRGLSFHDFHRLGVTPFVVRAEIEYKSPATVYDELEIRGGITHWRRTGFTIRYQIFNQTSQKICAEAEMQFAFVRNSTGRIVPVPEEFKRKMTA